MLPDPFEESKDAYARGRSPQHTTSIGCARHRSTQLGPPGEAKAWKPPERACGRQAPTAK
eukprot:9306365-Alexandrium_andersonii.AAC.1